MNNLDAALWKIQCMLKMQEASAEMERIKLIEDLEQQGYESAPLICQITGASPALLLESAQAKPFTDADSRKRDVGLIRWCKEQLRHGLRAV